MSEIAKTVEPKKEAVPAEQTPSVKPVVEKPKAKLVKAIVPTKKVVTDDANFGDGEISIDDQKEYQAFFRDPSREFPLKDLDMSLLRGKLKRHVNPYARNSKNSDINYSQSYKHMILRNMLFVIDNRSGITLSEKMWIDSDSSITYLNEDMSNVPSDIIVLENSTILASYISISGESLLRSSTLKASYSVTCNDSTVVNGSARAINSLSIMDSALRAFSFVGDSIALKNLNISEYYINVKGAIRLDDVRWSGSNGLRIYGDSIKDVEISRNGTIHNTGSSCWFDYYGEKTISICSTRRVDNGFFMGSAPIPFIRCDEGLLVGGTVFTYADFKLFIETTMDKLAPPKQVDNNYQSFRPLPPLTLGYQNGFASAVQNNLPGEILNKLYQMISNPHNNARFNSRRREEEKYTEVDSLLTLTNEQIAMLAGQISSRLRLFKELDALI